MSMDLRAMISAMNDSQARTRGEYHLNYGELVRVLKAAPSDATVDKRFKGIGSWRGSYTEIAILTDESGTYAEKEEFTDYADYSEKYQDWAKENVVEYSELPTNANELGSLLESLLGLQFVGYKGGNFTIEEYKPLWLTPDSGTSGNTAIGGIDKKLNFITKEVD